MTDTDIQFTDTDISVSAKYIGRYIGQPIYRSNPTQEPFQEIDLDNFDIGNIDSLAPWERNAHLWINEQILSIKNENYE